MIKSFLKKIIPSKMIVWSHKVRGILAAIIFGFPAKKMKIIGVTGTNGKTTTCHLIGKILEEAGFKVGIASTIRFKVAEKEIVNETNMTTVSPFALQKMLKEMSAAKCEYGIIETTSHSIDQYRNWGIPYEVIVLTNITHDHLDYHRTFKNYKDTKLKIFKQNRKIHVINFDDPSVTDFMKTESYQKFTYSLIAKNQKADLRIFDLNLNSGGSVFKMITPIGEEIIELNLPGSFNIANALAASATAISQGIGLDLIKKALAKIENIPGRIERIPNNRGFDIMIDYAHTPDALEKIYKTLRPITKGKIISVLGACGDRDKAKRPILGALAGKFADMVIVTSEEPYGEDTDKIIESVAKGVSKKLGENFWKISDRRIAIRHALTLAQKDDLVLITGMGDQRYMVVGGKHIPWNEREVVREELDRIKVI